jgi:hypothetical protein
MACLSLKLTGSRNTGLIPARFSTLLCSSDGLLMIAATLLLAVAVKLGIGLLASGNGKAS